MFLKPPHLAFLTTVPSNERQPKMFLPFSHLIEEKIASFLTYLKSWWNLVLVFGKEHAYWSSINGAMIGRSWTIKSIIFLVTFLILKLHPIITWLILDELACSLPKTNSTFHQLFKYVKKDAIFSSIRWENS